MAVSSACTVLRRWTFHPLRGVRRLRRLGVPRVFELNAHLQAPLAEYVALVVSFDTLGPYPRCTVPRALPEVHCFEGRRLRSPSLAS